jgi:hypothetical protein
MRTAPPNNQNSGGRVAYKKSGTLLMLGDRDVGEDLGQLDQDEAVRDVLAHALNLQAPPFEQEVGPLCEQLSNVEEKEDAEEGKSTTWRTKA